MSVEFTLRTPWKFETSEESAPVLFGSMARGALYLVNEDDGEKMKISYHAVSIGHGKGPSYGYSWSTKSDPSGGFDNVAVVRGRNFGPLSFPCRGYILGMGASVSTIAAKGIAGDQAPQQTSGGLTIILFGIVPVFAGLKLWGLGNSLMPGIGASAGIATFQVGDDW